jgi:branched-chain amino acid transport system permease protein
MWAQGILNGFSEGSIYILIAMGLAIIFSIMRILQFAHGEIYMLGAYVVYIFNAVIGVNYLAALIISGIAMGILGLILERFIFRRFRGQTEPAMLAAIGLTLIFQTLAVILFGSYIKYYETPEMLSGVLSLYGLRLPMMNLLIIIAGVVLVIVLLLVIRKTKIGHAMVAISQDVESAALQGINVNRISAFSLAIGCVLGAIAGGLMGALLQISPFMGGFALTKGIAVIIIAGIGSIPGTIVGGLILGFVDSLVPLVASTTIANIVGFSIIILILVFKPKGLWGHD